MKATPTPWSIGLGEGQDGAFYIRSGRKTVAKLDTESSLSDEANAALIVRAVNSHERLVAALKAALPILENPSQGDHWFNEGAEQLQAALTAARQALATATK